MSPQGLARELRIDVKRLRSWLRAEFRRPESEKGTPWDLTRDQVDAARKRFGSGTETPVQRAPDRPVRTRATPSAPPPRTRARSESDEAYVIDLCDELLGERGKRQHRFPWILGDPGTRGQRAQLQVDAFYEQHRLVVEYMERQHDEASPFFDKRETVSGVGRGDQRRLYDRRRAEEIPKHGLHLLLIRPDQLKSNSRGRLLRNAEHDRVVLNKLLKQAVG